jgi:hypothetical protein
LGKAIIFRKGLKAKQKKRVVKFGFFVGRNDSSIDQDTTVSNAYVRCP